MSTPTAGATEQAVAIPSRTVDTSTATPPRSQDNGGNSSANAGGGSFPKAPDKPQYGEFQFGRAGLGNKEGITGSTEVDLKLEMEFEAFDLLDKLEPTINIQTSDAELSLHSEIIRAKFEGWQKKQELLRLYRMEMEERKKVKELEVPERQGLRHIRERYMNRGEALRNFEKKIAERKKRIKEYIDTKEGTSDSERQAKLEKLKAIKKELGFDSIDLTIDKERQALEAQLKAYTSEKPQHIFNNIDEVIQTYAYLEQVEKVVVLQAGYDITDGGTRTIQLDFSNQNIQRLVTEGRDLRIVQALQDIGNRIRVRDLRGVEEILAAGGVGLWEYFGVQLPVSLPVVGTLTGLGGPVAAGVGVASMVMAKLVARRIYNWYVSFPAGKAPEEVKFQLNFQKKGPELGDSKDPIRQLYRGRIDEAGLFLKNCESFRVGLAKALKVHEGELEGWLNLSSTALGATSSGMEMPHRIAISKKLEKVLELKYKKAAGGHKELDELSLEEQLDVFTAVSDSVVVDFATVANDEIAKNIAIRKALGLKEKGGIDWTQRKSAVGALNKDIKDGKRVFHRKEGAQTVEEAEAEAKKLDARKTRLGQLKEGYTAKLEAHKTKEAEYEKEMVESEKLQLLHGHVVTSRDPMTGRATAYTDRGGQFEVLNQEKTQLETDIVQLNSDIGFDTTTKKYITGGLYLKYRDAKLKYETAKKKHEARQTQRAEAVRVKTELEAEGAPPKTIKKQQAIIATCDKDLPILGKDLEDTDNAFAKYKDDYETKAAELQTKRTRLGKIPDELRENRKPVIEQEAKAAAARAARNGEFKKVKEILREFGYTEAEMNAADFAIPTTATLEGKVTQAETEFKKKDDEYKEMKKRVDAGNAAVVSDEDLERVKVNELLGERITVSFLNQLMSDLYDGKLTIEEFTKVAGDAGYNYLLKRIFGEDSLSTGPEGKYRLVTQLFSKARLVDAIFEVWQLDGQTTHTGFFAGDSEGLRLYQESQFVKLENTRLAKKINQLELTKPPPDGVAEEITRLRGEYQANSLTRNELLARLYDRPDRADRRLAAFLGQDRIKTAETLRVVLDGLYNDALNGFVEVVSPPAGARTEVAVTSVGQVSVSETSMDQFNRQILQRGEFDVTGMMGYPGVSVDIKLTTDNPTAGNIDVAIRLDRDHAGLDNLPNLPPVNLPGELAIVYGNVDSRKSAVNLADFTQEMFNSVTYPTRNAATTAGMNNVLVDLIYGPDPASGKKTLNQIKLSAINLATLPATKGAVGTAPEIVKDFFYYYADVRRKELLNWDESGPAIAAAHAVLPANRGAAATAGFTAEILDMFYGANAADPPRSIADITTGRDINGAEFNLNALPYLGTVIPATVPARVRNLFYETRGRKRNNVDIDGYITSLPATRAAASALGLSAEVINLLYEPGAAGAKRDALVVREIIIPRDHTQIQNVYRLVNLIDSLRLRGVTPATEVMLANIAESFSMMDEVSKSRMFGGKFTPFSIDTVTEVSFLGGDMIVTYIDATSHNRHPMKLNDYLKTNVYPAEMGHYLATHPNHKKKVITEAAKSIIETIRSTNI